MAKAQLSACTIVIVIAFMIVLSFLTAGVSAQTKRQNVLFVVVDDLPTHVEPYLSASHPLKDATIPFTPNIQALAEESVIFDRAYVQNAATPLELQLFTKYSVKKVPSMPVTMPKWFQKTHYVVGIGKIFHSPWPTQFNKYITVNSGDTICGPGKNSCTLTEQLLIDAQVAARALWLIDQAPNNKPWFAFVGFHRPHWMYSTSTASLNDITAVQPEVVVQTRAASREGALDPPNPLTNGSPFWASASSGQAQRGNPIAVDKAANMRQWIYASTQWMDECLGRLMDGLKQRGEWNNTIVILASDNGVMMFDRAQSGKSVLFNSAKRVPLMIRYPNYSGLKGLRSGAMAELLDVFPTVADLVGLTPPSYASGQSLLPVLKMLNRSSVSYWASAKFGTITIESRCAVSLGNFNNLQRGQNYTGQWIACHQLPNVAANRVEMFGISIQTMDWNYIEWRVAQSSGSGLRFPRWDTAGLWGRELYDFRADHGFVTLNGVQYEAQNIAPCPISCYPRSLNTLRIDEDNDSYYRLPNDDFGFEFDPPDMDAVAKQYQDVVRRLSLVLRSQVRDKQPLCSGHGSANPVNGKCDQCIQGWTGDKCEVPMFPELQTQDFPFPPTQAPTSSPTGAPSMAPTFQPTGSPVTFTLKPTRLPTKRPTPRPYTRFPTVPTPRHKKARKG